MKNCIINNANIILLSATDTNDDEEVENLGFDNFNVPHNILQNTRPTSLDDIGSCLDTIYLLTRSRIILLNS